MPRLVIFDMAGVLFDESYAKSMKKEIKAMLKRNKPLRIDKKDAEWIKLSAMTKTGKITFRQARLEYLQYLGLKPKLIKEYSTIEKKWENRIKLKDRKMLFYLSRLRKMGIKIAILSNTGYTTKNRNKILRRLGIIKLVDGVFCSSKIGYVKPDRMAYLAVLDAMNIWSGDAVFVGYDKWELRGAMRAGIRAVMFRGSIKKIFTDIIKR